MLDPEGKDAALHQMVVIGHSQGGLLTKMTAIDSGDRFWRLLSDEPFDPADFDPEARELIRKSVFLSRCRTSAVIFLSTPHHGSYIAGNWLAHQVARFIVLPAEVTKAAGELVAIGRRPSSVRERGHGDERSRHDTGPPFRRDAP